MAVDKGNALEKLVSSSVHKVRLGRVCAHEGDEGVVQRRHEHRPTPLGGTWKMTSLFYPRRKGLSSSFPSRAPCSMISALDATSTSRKMTDVRNDEKDASSMSPSVCQPLSSLWPQLCRWNGWSALRGGDSRLRKGAWSLRVASSSPSGSLSNLPAKVDVPAHQLPQRHNTRLRQECLFASELVEVVSRDDGAGRWQKLPCRAGLRASAASSQRWCSTQPQGLQQVTPLQMRVVERHHSVQLCAVGECGGPQGVLESAGEHGMRARKRPAVRGFPASLSSCSSLLP